MTNKEQLSALMDAELDELNERRLLRSLDAESRATWERYHLIRSAMTGRLDSLAEPGLPDRVMARLDQEVIENHRLRFWPLAGGFVAAASVAAVALFALQTFQQPIEPASMQTANVAGTTALPSRASTVANSAPTTQAASAPASVTTSDDRLNPYLVGHNEFMPTAGMGGMLPYVRVVAHQQDK